MYARFIPKSIFRILRIPNLLMIALTIICMRFFILYPVLRFNAMDLQLNPFLFSVLVLSTLCMAAAGYIINDYYDIDTDRLNQISRASGRVSGTVALTLYFVLNLTGIAGGLLLSFAIGMPGFSILFILPAGLLYFYSVTYKFQFLLGNLIISALTGLVPLMAVVFEVPLLNLRYRSLLLNAGTSFKPVLLLVALFSGFAFITNFLREIIKDMADAQGDSVTGKKTIPVIFGIGKAKICVFIITLLIIAALTGLFTRYLVSLSDGSIEFYSFFYLLFFIVIPLLYVIYTVIRAHAPADYRMAASVVKIIMVTGVLYSAVLAFLVLNFTT